MAEDEPKIQLRELVNIAMDSIDVAVTIIDTKGMLLYYNQHASTILDRKPEYIGMDIRSHHKKADSNKRIDRMIQEFEAGRKEHFHYQAKPYGEIMFVTVSPLFKDGVFIGCVQTVRSGGQTFPQRDQDDLSL